MRSLEDVIRSGQSPDGLAVLLRGGTDTRDKLVRNADSMAKRFTYDGQPTRGISLFAAHGDLEERMVLGSRLSTYRTYYKVGAADVAGLGLLLPTFVSPHWTLLFEPAFAGRSRPLEELVEGLLAILGPLLENPKYVPPEAYRR